MRETWYLLENGAVAHPNTVAPDENGRLLHKDGVAVKMRGDVPHTTGVDLDDVEQEVWVGTKSINDARKDLSLPVLVDREVTADKPKRTYKTREK